MYNITHLHGKSRYSLQSIKTCTNARLYAVHKSTCIFTHQPQICTENLGRAKQEIRRCQKWATEVDDEKEVRNTELKNVSLSRK